MTLSSCNFPRTINNYHLLTNIPLLLHCTGTGWEMGNQFHFTGRTDYYINLISWSHHPNDLFTDTLPSHLPIIYQQHYAVIKLRKRNCTFLTHAIRSISPGYKANCNYLQKNSLSLRMIKVPRVRLKWQLLYERLFVHCPLCSLFVISLHVPGRRIFYSIEIYVALTRSALSTSNSAQDFAQFVPSR